MCFHLTRTGGLWVTPFLLPPPQAYVRTSLWRENISWMKAAFFRRSVLQPVTLIASWVSQLFSCMWLLVFPKVLCLLWQRTCQKQFCCFTGQIVNKMIWRDTLVYSTTQFAFQLVDSVLVHHKKEKGKFVWCNIWFLALLQMIIENVKEHENQNQFSRTMCLWVRLSEEEITD